MTTLEAVETIKKMLKGYETSVLPLSIIETELAKYGKLLMKDTELARTIIIQKNDIDCLNFAHDCQKERAELAERKLEIIKEKNVCISVLKDSNSVEEYNDIICYHKVCSMSYEKPIPLSQEEFDLLRKALL